MNVIGWRMIYRSGENNFSLEVFKPDQADAIKIGQKVTYGKLINPETAYSLTDDKLVRVPASEFFKRGLFMDGIHSLTFMANWGIATQEIHPSEVLEDEGTLHKFLHWGIRIQTGDFLYEKALERLIEQEKRLDGFCQPGYQDHLYSYFNDYWFDYKMKIPTFSKSYSKASQ